jgi:hypothetical protein
MGLEMGSQPFHPILNGKHRTAEKHEVTARCGGDCVSGYGIHRSAVQGEFRLRWVTVPADNLAGKLSSAQRQTNGSADEAGSNDRYAMDGHRSLEVPQKK